MKARIEFKLSTDIVLPINYNHLLQAVILNWINEESYQKFVHDMGYKYNDKKFKLGFV